MRGGQRVALVGPSGAGKSLLIVTHRLMRLEIKDQILVLDRRQVMKKGTHAMLLGKEGLYNRLRHI